MMTFHHRTNLLEKDKVSSGFTLLEMVIVLAVVGAVLGGAITVIILSSSERKLTNISSELEVLAKKARTASILHQTSYAIEFRKDSVVLLPLTEAGDTERKTALGRNIGGTDSQESAKPATREIISIDPDLSLTIRHWNNTKFIKPTENIIPIWRFDPDGLSEPITIRFELGNSYTQNTFNPLNATIADTESTIN